MSLSLAIRQKRLAGDPERKARGRVERLGRLLVEALNRRDGLLGELRHHDVDLDRRRVLEARLRDVEEEQDRIEAEMTRAYRQWAALVGNQGAVA